MLCEVALNLLCDFHVGQAAGIRTIVNGGTNLVANLGVPIPHWFDWFVEKQVQYSHLKKYGSEKLIKFIHVFSNG